MENNEVYFATAVPALKEVGYVLVPGSNQRLK